MRTTGDERYGQVKLVLNDVVLFNPNLFLRTDGSFQISIGGYTLEAPLQLEKIFGTKDPVKAISPYELCVMTLSEKVYCFEGSSDGNNPFFEGESISGFRAVNFPK